MMPVVACCCRHCSNIISSIPSDSRTVGLSDSCSVNAPPAFAKRNKETNSALRALSEYLSSQLGLSFGHFQHGGGPDLRRCIFPALFIGSPSGIVWSHFWHVAQGNAATPGAVSISRTASVSFFSLSPRQRSQEARLPATTVYHRHRCNALVDWSAYRSPKCPP